MESGGIQVLQGKTEVLGNLGRWAPQVYVVRQVPRGPQVIKARQVIKVPQEIRD